MECLEGGLGCLGMEDWETDSSIVEGWTEGWDWTWISGVGSLALCALACIRSPGTGLGLVGRGLVLARVALARKSIVGLGMEVSGILDSWMGRRPWDWTRIF